MKDNPNFVNSLEQPEYKPRLAQVSLGSLALRFAINTAVGLGTLGAAETVTNIPSSVSSGYMAALGASAAFAHLNRHK